MAMEQAMSALPPESTAAYREALRHARVVVEDESPSHLFTADSVLASVVKISHYWTLRSSILGERTFQRLPRSATTPFLDILPPNRTGQVSVVFDRSQMSKMDFRTIDDSRVSIDYGQFAGESFYP